MTLLSETTSRWSGARSRYLRALPLTALAIDIAIMVGIGLVAIVGRRELDIFTSSAQDCRASVATSRSTTCPEASFCSPSAQGSQRCSSDGCCCGEQSNRRASTARYASEC